MKKILLVFVLIIGIKSVFAECSSDGMYFFPATKEISLNSMFIIEGYAYSQETVESFRNRKVYLEDKEGQLIELILQTILKGEMELTQAIFKPEKELKRNTIYFLKYANQTEHESLEMQRYNIEKDEMEKVYWQTTDKKSMAELNTDLSIEFEKTEVQFFGCGPEANAVFGVKNKPNAEIWYKTEVIEIEINKKNIYYLWEWDGKLWVGHGMCSGAFIFQDKGRYKVRFTPMNTDGKSLATTGWTVFESPFTKDNAGF